MTASSTTATTSSPPVQDPSLHLALVCLDAVQRSAAAGGFTFTFVLIGSSGQQVLAASCGPDESDEAGGVAQSALLHGAAVERTAAAGAPLPDLTLLGARIGGAVGVVSTASVSTTPLHDLDASLRRDVRNQRGSAD